MNDLKTDWFEFISENKDKFPTIELSPKKKRRICWGCNKDTMKESCECVWECPMCFTKNSFSISYCQICSWNKD